MGVLGSMVSGAGQPPSTQATAATLVTTLLPWSLESMEWLQGCHILSKSAANLLSLSVGTWLGWANNLEDSCPGRDKGHCREMGGAKDMPSLPYDFVQGLDWRKPPCKLLVCVSEAASFSPVRLQRRTVSVPCRDKEPIIQQATKQKSQAKPRQILEGFQIKYRNTLKSEFQINNELFLVF